jgi:hypothetical protein
VAKCLEQHLYSRGVGKCIQQSIYSRGVGKCIQQVIYSRGVERPINVIYSRGVGKCMHRNNNTHMQGDVKTREYVRTFHYISSD